MWNVCVCNRYTMDHSLCSNMNHKRQNDVVLFIYKKTRKDFMTMWKKEVGYVYEFDGKASMLIFTHALRFGEFYKHLNTHLPRSYDELMRTANRFAEPEVADRKKREEEDGKGG